MVIDPEPKQTGESVRICIAPDEYARSFGVRINRIESYNFTRDGEEQAAIEFDAQPALNARTVVNCVPGSMICAFRTIFFDEFFASDGSVQGFGSVVLEYSEGTVPDDIPSATARRRSLEGSYPEKHSYGLSHRLLQEEPAFGFAGTAMVNTTTDVTDFTDKVDPCIFDHKVTEWWVEEDINDRYKYIGIAVGSLLAAAASLLLCWCCPCLSKRSKSELAEQDIKVNVDVKSDKKEDHVIDKKETKSSKHLSSSDSDTYVSGEKPRDDDICFDERNHPGTRTFIKAVRNYVENKGGEKYNPKAYRDIKRRFDGARYFLIDEDGRYVQPDKDELIDLIGSVYDEARSGGRRGSSRRSSKSSLRDEKRDKMDKRSSSRRVVSEKTSTREVTKSKSNGGKSTSKSSSKTKSSKRYR